MTVLPAKEETTDATKQMGSKVIDVEEATPLPTKSTVQRPKTRQESVVTDVEEAPVLGVRCTNTFGVVLVIHCGMSPLGGVIVEGGEGGIGYHRCSHRG